MKSKIRKEYLNIRKNIENKEIKSKIIFEKIIQNENYINAKNVALYKSMQNEVNTNMLIEYSLDKR